MINSLHSVQLHLDTNPSSSLLTKHDSWKTLLIKTRFDSLRQIRIRLCKKRSQNNSAHTN